VPIWSRDREGALLLSFHQEESMSLVLGTILWVVGVTALVGLAAYALDRSTARQERRK
jgi:hypothetical protein